MKIKFFIRIFHLIFLSKKEKQFIKKNSEKLKIKKNLKKNILVQISPNYIQLLYFKILFFFKFKDCNIIGLWSISINPRKNYWISRYISKILYGYNKKKWFKLYQSIGVKKFYDQDVLNKKVKKNCKDITSKIYLKIKTKKDVLDVKYKSIKLGDLIYDTYLRYAAQPTILLNDKFLKLIIYNSIKSLFKLEYLNKKYNFKTYVSSYAVYINHGVPVRFFLNKKVSTYTNGSPYYTKLKKLSDKDFLHTASYKKFKKNFEMLNNKKQKINFAKYEIQKKFRGGDDVSTRNKFVIKNTYKSKIKFDNNLKKIEGVLFLHDFFDSPHLWGDIIFEDFYEWTIFTLELIKKHNLKIGIKIHPNSKPESFRFNKILKARYPNLIWINKDLSNLSIFKTKNILYGISCYGSVLYELPYHNKTAFSAGSNPSSGFDILVKSKNINDYKMKLLNPKKYLIKKNLKNEIHKLYYMYFLKNIMEATEKEDIISNKINLMGVDQTYDLDLLNFNKKIDDILMFS